jgi:tetratricopeptide (TPR) repeat protein
MSEINQQEQNHSEHFVKKNQKQITAFLVILVSIVGGYFGYMELYQKPREIKAADAMFAAENYFFQDSSKLVLNGDGTSKGVLYIIKTYSGTKAENLANFYAGVSYYKLGDLNKSIQYLKDFSTDAKQIQSIAYGTLGDAYADLKKNTEALDYYKKAGANFPEDEVISSEYLFRAAQLQEVLGKTDDAVAIYKDIKAKYPKTEIGLNVDKFIFKLKVQP